MNEAIERRRTKRAMLHSLSSQSVSLVGISPPPVGIAPPAEAPLSLVSPTPYNSVPLLESLADTILVTERQTEERDKASDEMLDKIQAAYNERLDLLRQKEKELIERVNEQKKALDTHQTIAKIQANERTIKSAVKAQALEDRKERWASLSRGGSASKPR